ncbi:hypothetical protein [Cupriavidus lacunae]|uniref:Uncharacterized protein n=1 Tax=Cupriavidus lacunae TaxID=2666307 RepID=A0A370MVM5_9BURK|nr:hypothetical protein [Cupriavidus lacunae]RDJ97384.1 hypothetical protein DN412_42530 [Cupriavidus lacunae]
MFELTGGRDILTLDRGSATVKVSVESELDEQAFAILLARGEVKQWALALDAEERHVSLARRYYELIYKLETANDRDVEHRLFYLSWISKTRGDLHICEQPAGFVETEKDTGWVDIRTHFEYMGLDLIGSYPYIALSMLDGDNLSLIAAKDMRLREIEGHEIEDEFYPFEWDDEDEYDGEFMELPTEIEFSDRTARMSTVFLR